MAVPLRLAPNVHAMPPGAVRAAYGHVRPLYLPIDLDGLVIDSVVSFHLYLQSAPGHFVLFRGPDLPFNAEHHGRLLTNRVQTLWLRGDERRRYEAYVEQHLDTLLANPLIPLPRRAALLTGAAQATLESVMAAPRQQDVVPRTRRVAQQTVRMLVRSPDAVGHLASLMAHDYDTVRHSMNVSVFAVGLAHAAGVRESADLQELALGTLLHDIGKTEIPRELITKAGAYTDDEFAIMRTHVERGEQILAETGRLGHLGMVAVAQHHERLTGTGYPRQLSDTELHLFGRITAIADCFDAMTSERSYQHAMRPAAALHLMRTHLAAHFDQTLLDQFIRTLRIPR